MGYPLHRDESAVAASPSFPALEHEVLEYWATHDTFRRSIANREGCAEWVFYDGPPFANGLPHYGHLLTGYAKDLFPRFQTMRGKQVHRRFGWDTHGLPAELEAMKQLGITEKAQIEQMGIEAFNAKARESVLAYTDEWQRYVTRQARWVDFENDYKTLDTSFMESVLWAFKTLYEKGLAYEGYRVLPYCWRDETPLSNHELRMDDDVYQMRQDQSVTVTFPLVGPRAEALGLTGVKALAWTTTPWTLPTNMALAVGPAISYVVLPAGPNGAADDRAAADAQDAVAGESQYLLAADTVAAYAKELGYASAQDAQAAVTRTLEGAELGGVHYDRIWDYYADTETWGTEHAWQILVAEYVATGEGTGIVHQAPAYGEDDQTTCAAAGIPVIISVDDGGRFLSQIAEVAGLHVFEANKTLTGMLREQGRLLQVRSYEHSYPHCWRCRNPLIYKAVSSWFVRVTAIRERMLELNEQITWVPENVGTASSASGSRARATGRSAATGTGAAPSRCGAATTPSTRASTSTARSPSSRPTSARCPATRTARSICTARSSTRSRGRTPTTRPAARRCAASRTSSTCGSTRARCPSPRCTTPSRTRSGSTATTRATSSSSTSGRRAAGSTRCTCSPRRCSTAPRTAR